MAVLQPNGKKTNYVLLNVFQDTGHYYFFVEVLISEACAVFKHFKVYLLMEYVVRLKMIKDNHK